MAGLNTKMVYTREYTSVNHTYNDVDVWYGVGTEANTVKRDTISVVDSIKSVDGATEEAVVWLA